MKIDLFNIYDEKDVVDNIKNTYISKSGVHGRGLFTESVIEKNTVLCNLEGQVIPYDVYEKYGFIMEWNAITEDSLLIRTLRTKYSYINHSREPNLMIKYNPIRIVAMTDIDIGTELFLDYRKEPLNKKYIDKKGKNYL